MARATNTNWLSFSLSPMEMLRSSPETQFVSYENSSSSTVSPHYLMIDNFYANGWQNPKLQAYYSGEEETLAASMAQHNQAVPKLEDFFGDSSSTQDSSLTHIYEQGSAYFNDQQDLKAITGFQALSTNSGSEVDDSSIPRTQFACTEFTGHSIDSTRNELGFSNCASGALSLAVNNDEKALVSVDSDSTKKIADTFGQRTSIYRGVTRHRWTGRYEAHLWDNSCRREGQARKGRQVYLGGYDKEDKAARAYDLAALKYWGPTASTNFSVSIYTKELEEMKHATKQEFIASLRRKSSGFSRGASIYRGVTRHHQQGRWQARIGRVAGNKDLYLGTFATEEEAAEAYDIAAIKFRGLNAVTNFVMSRYDVEAIMKSALPVGGAAKRLKISLDAEQKQSPSHDQHQPQCSYSNINFGTTTLPVSAIPCGIPYDHTAATTLYHHNLLHHLQTTSNFGNADLDLAVSTSSTAAGPLAVFPQSGEVFIWPNQSY
ncbi:AP2-like ethylene-responsive transcription factor AIL6 [Tripterygium wilfordii]|uniref:AP2-like ethylene-responsive transcription factor AIL6 n=1 Tax=Tripterygium wilfordii TaxID=458696 RepID=UPI0018F7FD66|nr:AP2-like ethylene-responsive transcription factor AIL6 [Tripterygium wilfordii]